MNGAGLEVAPEILNRIEVRGVQGKANARQAASVVSKELVHGFGGVIARPILNQNERDLGFVQDFE